MAASDNIYIADLPGDVTDDIIHAVFGAYGTVMSCRTMQGKFEGQKGAALVRFSSANEAEAVIGATNGETLPGLEFPVKTRFAGGKGPQSAQQQQPQFQAFGSQGAGVIRPGGAAGMIRPGMAAAPVLGGQGEAPQDNIYIADLPGDVTDELVHQVFGAYGTVMICKSMPAKFDGQKGAALIRFASAEEAAAVVQFCSMSIPAGLAEMATARFATQKGSKGPGGMGGQGGGGYGKVVSLPGARSAPYGAPQEGQFAGGGNNRTKSMSDINVIVQDLRKSKSLPSSSEQPLEHQLYIMGLPVNTTDNHLYMLFSPFGAIPLGGAHAMLDRDGSGACSGVGFVVFCSPESAAEALNAFNGMELHDGVTLKVSIKKTKKN